MTYRQWLISELAMARKKERLAIQAHKSITKATGGDGDDQNFYDLLLTGQTVAVLEGVLSAHREMTDNKKSQQ